METEFWEALNHGIAACQIGDYDQAIQYFQKSIQLNPQNPGAHHNLGYAYEITGSFAQAIHHYQQATQLRPQDPWEWFHLGNVYQKRKQWDEAIAAYQQALRLFPHHPDIHNNLGGAFFQMGALKQAAFHFRKTLEIHPAQADTLKNLGHTLNRQQHPQQAIVVYQQALGLKPNDIDTLMGLGQAFQTMGRLHQALNTHLHVFQLDPDHLENLQHMAKILEFITINPNQDIADALLKCLNHSEVDTQNLGHIAYQILHLCPSEPLLSHPLFLPMLRHTLVRNWPLEQLLTHLRYQILTKQLTVSTELMTALALQCSHNEYIFAVSDEENKILDTMGNPETPHERLIYRMYRPDINAKTYDIPIMTGISKTSQAVKQQYEETPYPRWWQLTHQSPQPLAQVMRSLFPHFQPPNFPEPIQILIAGCGTGKHALETAQRFANSQVLAIDLSTNSLRYAHQKAQEYGLENIRFMVGDLLKLANSPTTYHIIECVGVLHHLENPLAGWQALVQQLVPGGLMKIGLYHSHMRKKVTQIQEQFKLKDGLPTPQNIRQARQNIMNEQSPNNMPEILNSPDFYTLSACRDLLFHTRECGITIAQIQAGLNALNLTFIGTEISLTPQIPLEEWRHLEQSHPDRLPGLFTFWCQKARPAGKETPCLDPS